MNGAELWKLEMGWNKKSRVLRLENFCHHFGHMLISAHGAPLIIDISGQKSTKVALKQDLFCTTTLPDTSWKSLKSFFSKNLVHTILGRRSSLVRDQKDGSPTTHTKLKSIEKRPKKYWKMKQKNIEKWQKSIEKWQKSIQNDKKSIQNANEISAAYFLTAREFLAVLRLRMLLISPVIFKISYSLVTNEVSRALYLIK